MADKFKKTFNSANPVTTFVTSPRSGGATTIACDSLTGWPTSTEVDFITYQLSTDGVTPVANTQIDWVGTVSGSNIINITRKAGASDTGNSVNDVVQAMPTGTWANDLITGILVEHTQAGLHAIGSSSTLTSPKVITSLNDTNGNELIKVTATGSAVNELTIANAATGNGPTISATGGDTNVDINIAPKGTGQVKGLVNHLYNPYKFSVYLAADQSISSSTWTKVQLNTENFDTNNDFDATTNYRFTAPITGYYHIHGQVGVTQAGAGPGVFLNSAIWKNAAPLVTGSTNAGSGSANVIPREAMGGLFYLSAGDYIELYIYVSEASRQACGGSGVTFLTGYLVSAT